MVLVNPSLLTTSLFSAKVDKAILQGSLPDVLAWLSQGKTVSFRAIRPHQQHPWHAFLVQLAALCLQKGDVRELPQDPQTWRDLILHLTGGDESPWCLVVEDLEKPAFLQPPISAEEFRKNNKIRYSPSNTDILWSCARNFDLKRDHLPNPSLEHWVYAIICYQTFNGYLKGHYGSSRMNSGLGNRPCVTLAASTDLAVRFKRDVKIWLEERSNLIAGYGFDPEGHSLLWTLPWDGKDQLRLTELDPFYIDICRRLRLFKLDGKNLRLLKPGGKIAAKSLPSKVARVDVEKGLTGDIWTPVQITAKGRQALTVSDKGFHYNLLNKIIFTREWTCPAVKWREEDGPHPVLIASTLVRSQGKTKGYFHRVIPVPSEEDSDDLPQGVTLGSRSTTMLQRARDAQSLLRRSLKELLPQDHNKFSPILEQFDRQVDEAFFPAIFWALKADSQEFELRWQKTLYSISRQLLKEAERMVSADARRHLRAVYEARKKFNSRKKTTFPSLVTKKEKE